MSRTARSHQFSPHIDGVRPVLDAQLHCVRSYSAESANILSFYRDGQSAAGALSGGGQSPRVIGRTCQNCHSQIHGSNHPAGARFQR